MQDMNNIKLCDIADYISKISHNNAISTSFYLSDGLLLYKTIVIGEIKLFYHQGILVRITLNGGSYYNENATIAEIANSA